MCRTLVSVGWDGYLYDCDFNLAKGIYLGGRKRQVSEMTGPPEPGRTHRHLGPLLRLHGRIRLHLRGSHQDLSSGQKLVSGLHY